MSDSGDFTSCIEAQRCTGSASASGREVLEFDLRVVVARLPGGRVVERDQEFDRAVLRVDVLTPDLVEAVAELPDRGPIDLENVVTDLQPGGLGRAPRLDRGDRRAGLVGVIHGCPELEARVLVEVAVPEHVARDVMAAVFGVAAGLRLGFGEEVRREATVGLSGDYARLDREVVI